MAKVIDTVAIKIIADATDVTGGMGKVTKEVQEAARIASSVASPLDKIISKQERLKELHAQGAIQNDAYNMTLARLRSRMDDLNASQQVSIRQFATQIPVFGQIVSAVTTVSGAFALLNTGYHMLSSAAREATQFVADSGRRIDEVADNAERLGMSVGALSELQLAARFADVGDFGMVTTGIEKMLVNVAKASDPASKSAKALADLGLSAEELIGLKPDQMFARIAAEIAEIPTNAERARIIEAIFSRSGNDLKLMIEQLERFNAEARNSGAVITEDMAKAIEEADEAWKRMTTRAEGLGNIIATALAPAVRELAKDMEFAMGEGLPMTGGMLSFLIPGAGTTANALAMAREAAKIQAEAERQQRESEGPSDAQKQENLAKAEATEAAKTKKDMESLAAMETKARMEYELSMIREIIKEDEELLKIEERKIQSAQKFKDSLLSPEEKSAKQIAEAMQLAEGGFLGQGDVNALVEREARSLTKAGGGESRLQAKMFGSQEAIAATLGRQGENDSQRLESMKQSLLEMAKRPPIEVKEVSAI